MRGARANLDDPAADQVVGIIERGIADNLFSDPRPDGQAVKMEHIL